MTDSGQGKQEVGANVPAKTSTPHPGENVPALEMLNSTPASQENPGTRASVAGWVTSEKAAQG